LPVLLSSTCATYLACIVIHDLISANIRPLNRLLLWTATQKCSDPRKGDSSFCDDLHTSVLRFTNTFLRLLLRIVLISLLPTLLCLRSPICHILLNP
jgi:hypothetical protein